MKVILKLIIAGSLLISWFCQANEDIDKQWAVDLGNSSREMVWQDLKSKFEEQEQLELNMGINPDHHSQKHPGGLYIFISTSMSKPLLKSYFDAANIYGGTLVFKGLPNNSFKELAKLVQEIVGVNELNKASFQIDDQAFERFDIEQVPTIILSLESEYLPNQSSRIIYDKMTGNVGIKYSLEQFASSGELKTQALEHLHGVNGQ